MCDEQLIGAICTLSYQAEDYVPHYLYHHEGAEVLTNSEEAREGEEGEERGGEGNNK